MNQVAFSNIVRQYIAKEYPAFLETISYQDDGSFDCTLENASKEFSVWVATYNTEITIGLESPDGDSGCHTHMSFYGEEPEDQLVALKRYLEEIFSNKLVFMHSSRRGYTWTSDIEKTLKKKRKSEIIQFFKWSDI